MSTSKIKLLIADDHHLFLEGIRSLLEKEEGMEIMAAASNGEEVLDLIQEIPVDICIIDINMPGLNGIDTAKYIKQHHSQIKIIILTTYNDKEFVMTMLKIGVEGYVLKNATKKDLVKAINEVMQGNNYFASDVHNYIVNDFMNKVKHSSREAVVLTKREKEIVQLLAQELTNDQIAERLHISFRTVETHRKNIMQKTKANNLAGLIKFAYAQGLIS